MNILKLAAIIINKGDSNRQSTTKYSSFEEYKLEVINSIVKTFQEEIESITFRDGTTQLVNPPAKESK